MCVLFMVKYISFGLRINRKLFFFTLPFLSFFSIRWAEEARHLSWGWNTRPSAWDWSLGIMKRVSLQRLPVTGCQIHYVMCL